MKAYDIPNFETIVNDKIFADDYIKYLVKEGRISEKLALSIKSNLQIGPKNNKILDKDLLFKIYNYLGNYEYNHLLKNVLAHNEYCPICFNELDYVDGFCKKCGFNFDWADLCSDDFKTMRKFADFVDSHEKLIDERDHWLEIDSDDGDNLSFELYTIIYFDEDLKKEFESLHLNEWVDLDDLFGYDDIYEEENIEEDNQAIQIDEIEFCKMADNKYRLVPRTNDSYVMPVDLNRFKLYKLVGQCNDADFALYDLSFVPWCFRQQLRDLSFKEGFLTHNACEANWDDFSKDLKLWQLKEFLEKHNVDSKGNKKQLVRKIRESNLPLEDFESEKTFLTQESYDYLEEYSWIQFYMDHLYHFDFLDFFDYLDDHDGSIEEVSLSYLEEHIRLAEDSLDFDYIMRTYEAKTRILHLIGNLNDALTYDMRILHLNMNPLCLENYKFPSHIPLVPENISNLKELKSEFGDEVILNSFNKNWNFMGFESTIIPKDEVWKYLDTALNSKYQNHGSRAIREKYFMSLNK